MPESHTSDLFDAHGLFTGDLGERVWPQLCRAIESDLEAAGWDQPAQLLAVSNPVETEASAGPEFLRHVGRNLTTPPPGAGADSLDLDAIAYSVGTLGEVDGNPVTALWGVSAPPGAAALLLTFEGWSVPHLPDAAGNPLPDDDASLPPSQHPRRQESRHVTMITRSGAVYSVTRTRGDDRVDEVSTPGGLLVEVLRRCLGLPTDPAPTTPADLLGRVAVNSAFTAVTGLAEGAPSENPDQRELRRLLNELTHDQRTRMLTEGLFSATRGAARNLVTQLIEHGALAWPDGPPDGELDIPESLREDTSLVRAARAADRLTFAQVVAALGPLLPPEVTAADPGWADEGILARRLCWREWPSQPEVLAEARHRLGDVARTEELLVHLGWASDAPAGPAHDDAGA